MQGTYEERLMHREGQSEVDVVKVPQFNLLPFIVESTNCLAMVSRRVAERVRKNTKIAILPLPFEQEPISFGMLWNDLKHNDPAHRLLSDAVIRHRSAIDMATNAPNILLITTDQHPGSCYGFEGRKVRTPFLDRLAKEGTRFSACITPNAVCQPARASILTGLLPLTHGVRNNGYDLDADIGEQGFAGAFAEAGYDTAFIGKAHFSTVMTYQPTGRPECMFSSANYDADWSGPYMGFDQAELMLFGHNWIDPEKPPHGLKYEAFFHADGRGDERIREYFSGYWENGGLAPQTWKSQLPLKWHNTTWVANQAISYLESRADDKPWVMWASFPDPHHPFDCPEPWASLHDPDEVDLPRHHTLDLERRPWWHKIAFEALMGRRRRRRNGPDTTRLQEHGNLWERITAFNGVQPANERELRCITANAYGMISFIDDEVGRMLAALEASGQADNTYIVFTSDHGDWLGDHGLVLKGPMFYESLLRIGLILRGPDIPADHVVHEPVSTLDLSATFGELAGVSPLIDQHAKSLVPTMHGASRDLAHSEWDLGTGRTGTALNLRCVRTKDYKLTVEKTSGVGEMYHLKDDPFEMDNLWDDPGYQAEQKELLDMIASRPNDETPNETEPVGIA